MTRYLRARNFAVVDITVLILLTISLVFPLRSDGLSLDIPVYEQEHSEWCWAAVCASVLALYLDSPPTQCEIAAWARNEYATAVGLDSCCTADDCCEMSGGYFSESFCNEANELEESPGAVSALLTAHNIPFAIVNGPLSFEEIIAAVNDRRPFIIRWAMMPGIGHFVLGYGYEYGETERIKFADPSSDPIGMYASFDWMVSGINDDGVAHYWTHTLLLHAAAPAPLIDDSDTMSPLDTEQETALSRNNGVADGEATCSALSVSAAPASTLYMVVATILESDFN